EKHESEQAARPASAGKWQTRWRGLAQRSTGSATTNLRRATKPSDVSRIRKGLIRSPIQQSLRKWRLCFLLNQNLLFDPFNMQFHVHVARRTHHRNIEIGQL